MIYVLSSLLINEDGVSVSFGESTRRYVVAGTTDKLKQELYQKQKQDKKQQEIDKMLLGPEADMDMALAQISAK